MLEGKVEVEGKFKVRILFIKIATNTLLVA